MSIAEYFYMADPFMKVLYEKGIEVLKNGDPNDDCQGWINEMIRCYPHEVVDALGNDPPEVFAALEDLYDEIRHYKDDEFGEYKYDEFDE